jgi:hypothetical protein
VVGSEWLARTSNSRLESMMRAWNPTCLELYVQLSLISSVVTCLFSFVFETRVNDSSTMDYREIPITISSIGSGYNASMLWCHVIEECC